MGFVRVVNERHKSRVLVAENIPWFAAVSHTKRWLIGVSGGADSVALLHLLVEAGFSNLVICHLDHGLRGRASAGDAAFVKRLAAKLGLSCEVEKANVKARMNDCSESMETAARHARHAFFAKCAVKCKCPRIVLAHHSDDQAETVLWNLLRGSHGLKGMRETQGFTTESGVILEFHRPLLAVRRADLIDWLISEKLKWREDASNAEPVAVRNRLRNEALPLLAEISGRDVAAAFVRGAEDAREAAELESWALKQAQVLDPQGRLHVRVLRSLPVVLKRAAFAEFLKSAGVPMVDRDALDRLIAVLDPGGPASVNLPQGFRMRRREGRMFLEPG